MPCRYIKAIGWSPSDGTPNRYTYLAWVSALLVLTGVGNAKASNRGTSNSNSDPRFLCLFTLPQGWPATLKKLNMKFAAFITTIFFGFSMVLAEEAEIIMRDGSIFKAEITQYNPQGIMFKEKGRSGLFSKLQKEAVSLPLDDIYMITTKSQGSRVVNKDGKLVNCDVMDDSEAEESIYLVHGGKLMGDIVSIGAEDIVYKYTKSTQKELKKYKKESQKDRSKVDPKKEAAYYYLYANIPISRDEVFMIYHEKTKVSEIITSLADVEEDIPQIVVEEPKEEEAAEPVQELKFHRVTKGQTLSMIASRYGVTPEEIIEWNDLNPKININGYLTPDLQLAIYITVE